MLSDDGVLPNLLRTARVASIVGFPASTTLCDSERAMILKALETSGWVVGGPYGAAAKLGMKRTTLIARMKKLDTDELTFPFAGSTRFDGMEEQPNLLCDPRALREGYLAALEEYLVEVRRGCARQGIDYALVRTSDYLDAVLSKFLHHRMALKSSVKARANV